MKVLITTYRQDDMAASRFRPLSDASITAWQPWSPQAKIVIEYDGKEIVVDRVDLVKALEALK